EPMGFDAFGIHSENFAIKQAIHPRILTTWNVERFRSAQLERSGCRFDWSHTLDTTDPRYYRWTQWIFLQLFKAEEVSALLRMLAPFAPHLAEELWARLGWPYSIHQQSFPVADASLLRDVDGVLGVQVNGRTRGVVRLPLSASEADALQAAQALPAVGPVLAH